MSVCARCPKVLGKSCCEPGPEDRLTTITRADVERIVAETGVPASAFVEHEWLTPDEALDYEARRPTFRGYFDAEPKRWTLARRNGACVFHSPGEGCSLPASARPVPCRLYPFEPWPDGTVAIVPERHGDLDRARAEGGGCLAVEEAEDLDALFAAFSTSAAEIRALAAQLMEDVRHHARSGAPGASGRRASRRKP